MSDGAREENRFNLEAVDILIRSGLVNMAQYDMFLYQLMEQSRSLVAVQFAMQLVQRYCVEDKHNTLVTEVFHPILFYSILIYVILFYSQVISFVVICVECIYPLLTINHIIC